MTPTSVLVDSADRDMQRLVDLIQRDGWGDFGGEDAIRLRALAESAMEIVRQWEAMKREAA